MSTTQKLRRSLAEANRVRKFRAELAGDIYRLPRHQGLAIVADLLECNPPEIRTMRITRLLAWVRRVGPTRAVNVMTSSLPFATEMLQCGDLTPRQRVRLGADLRAVALETPPTPTPRPRRAASGRTRASAATIGVYHDPHDPGKGQ